MQSMLNHKQTAAYAEGKARLDALKHNTDTDTDPVTIEDFHGFLAALTPEEKKNPALLLDILSQLQDSSTDADAITESIPIHEISASLGSIIQSNDTNSLSDDLWKQYHSINKQIRETRLFLQNASMGNNVKNYFDDSVKTEELSFLEPILAKMKKFESIDAETPAIFEHLTEEVNRLKELKDQALELIAERKQAIIDNPYPFDLGGKQAPATAQALFDGMSEYTAMDITSSHKKRLHSLNIKTITNTTNELTYDITNPKYLKQELSFLGGNYMEQPIEKLMANNPTGNFSPLMAFKASAKLLEACLPLSAIENRTVIPSVTFTTLNTKDAEAALQAFKEAHLDKKDVVGIAQAFIEANNLPQENEGDIQRYSQAMKEATKKAFEYLHSEYNNLPDLRNRAKD
jgi:hypothetical protein